MPIAPDPRANLRPAILAAIAVSLASLSACRNADDSSPAAAQAIVPSTQGANGCHGPNQTFSAPHTPATIALATLVIGPSSQITAGAGGELLYATGAGSTVVEIDLASGSPVETTLVATGTVAALLASVGILSAPSLSGVAVLDVHRLVIVEQTSNTLITADRTLPNTVAFFAGQPNTTPGFADGAATGAAGLARFSFVAPSQVCPTGDALQRVFVADPGNHAIRAVRADGFVVTIAGTGQPFFSEGTLSQSTFDTPTGLSIACNGTLIASERGDFGFGNRLRQLAVGTQSPFGGFFGSADTLVGDGTNATSGGTSATAKVSKPASPLVTNGGDVYWIDAGTGVLRRFSISGLADCPLAVDCATAVAIPTFPAGHAFSLTETDGGKLYVLDATAGVLYRVTP